MHTPRKPAAARAASKSQGQGGSGVPGPTYPTVSVWLFRTILHFGRTSAFAAIFFFLLYRPFIVTPVVQWFSTVDLGFVPKYLTSFFEGTDAPAQTNLRDATFTALLLGVTHTMFYWTLNSLDLLILRKGWLKELHEPRTQRMQLPPGVLRRTLMEAVVGQLLSPFMIFFFAVYFPPYQPIFSQSTPQLREYTILEFCGHFAACLFSLETLFYLGHRLCHEVPAIYRLVHKQHHMYVGVVGFGSEFAHPLEQLFVNYLSALFYITAFAPYLSADWANFWLIYRFLETYEIHSGLYFGNTWLTAIGLTNSESARFHDFHHTDNRGNYGWPWIDWLGGSMDSYLAHFDGTKEGKS